MSLAGAAQFFLVTAGRCEVLLYDTNVGERGVEQCVGRLHASDCFGERALLRNEPRAASIRAGPGCVLHVVFITRDDFEATMGKPLSEFQRLKKVLGTAGAAAKDAEEVQEGAAEAEAPRGVDVLHD